MHPLFAQIVTMKKPHGRTYKYVHIVEPYREGKSVKKRRIASLGNIDANSDKEILQIIGKLESLLQHRTRGTAEDLEPSKTVQFGVPYVVQFLWDQLGLTELSQCPQGSWRHIRCGPLHSGHGYWTPHRSVEQAPPV